MFSSLLGLKTLVVPLIVCCCLESKGFSPLFFGLVIFFLQALPYVTLLILLMFFMYAVIGMQVGLGRACSKIFHAYV